MSRSHMSSALKTVGALTALLLSQSLAAAEAVPPLVAAAQANNTVAVQEQLKLIPTGALPAATDGTTALHWAAHHANLELVDALLKRGALVNIRNDYGASPMSEAAFAGDAALIRRLLAAGADVESANPDGQTALMVLARGGQVDAAKVLLARGAKVNAKEAWRSQTALMWAAAQKHPAMVSLLIKHGADIEARSLVNNWERQITSEPRNQARPSGGYTPLLYAARSGCLECAKILVTKGANPNLRDPDGVSALLLAILNFNFDTASYLLRSGADPNLWDASGRGPLYAAVDLNMIPAGGRSDRPSLDETNSLQLIDQLLKAGANPNLQLKRMPPYRSLRDDRGADIMQTTGATALLRAARAADLPVMRLLLEHGARVDLPNINGTTPLMAAAGSASSKIDTRGRFKTAAQAVEAVQLLLGAGAEINLADKAGQTAVFGAATWGWNDVLETLIARGAKLDVKDARGRTVLDAAMGAGGASGRTASDPQPHTVAFLQRQLANAKN
jgi:uncharacterized protein